MPSLDRMGGLVLIPHLVHSCLHTSCHPASPMITTDLMQRLIISSAWPRWHYQTFNLWLTHNMVDNVIIQNRMSVTNFLMTCEAISSKLTWEKGGKLEKLCKIHAKIRQTCKYPVILNSKKKQQQQKNDFLQSPQKNRANIRNVQLSVVLLSGDCCNSI